MSDPAKPQGGPEGPAQPGHSQNQPSQKASASAFASASSSADGGATFESASASAGTDEVAALKAQVAELEAQKSDLTDRLLRAHAEMENLRKRTEREKSDAAKYAINKFANDIVVVGDNFQRAVESLPAGAVEADPTLKGVVDGVQMIERAFLQTLERHGVRRIDPKGEQFDPNRHQAVMETQNADVPSGSVLQVFQPGYIIEDRLIRPAMVVVARGGPKMTKAADNGATDASLPQGTDDQSPQGA